MTNKVRMFIGTSANGEDAVIEMAYEYSLRKNTERDLEITWMRKSNEGFWSGFNDKRWSTPFSGFRWAIPEACGFEGRAIYTDCDMLNFEDIGNLLDVEIPDDKWMVARDGNRFGGKEFCVIVFDCAKFKGNMPLVETWKHEETAHHAFIQQFQQLNLVGTLDPKWNSHDGDVEPFSILHYTHMPTQPWRPAWFTGEPKAHPRPDLAELVWEMAREAEENGYNIKDYTQNRGIGYGIIGK